ncbi:hypothetical protein [Neisseria perflava]|uniref:hypothetical protein n=1 Tax=Neisseria perflava TaxID=33053 RepID=UPI00209CE9B2|nr:hypothetical protein [Neisseria perflava]MCP1661004.1 hypothetical protein [Neisseria perflava]
MKRWLVYWLAAAIVPAFAADLSVSRQSFPLGATDTVEIVRYCAAEPDDVLLFHPHENETTAKKVGLAVLAQRGRGCLLSIEQRGRRRIAFHSDGLSVEFDPNRIYTEQGRRATLSEHGRDTEETAAVTAAFADELLQRYLNPAHAVIALHNNTNGATDIESYYFGDLAGANAPVSIHPQNDEDDYVYVLDSAAFDFFREQGFNVVQQTGSVPDDGSLSVYAAQNHRRYLNIEAEYGHKTEQQAMLEAAYRYLENQH